MSDPLASLESLIQSSIDTALERPPPFVFQYDANGCIKPNSAMRERVQFRASLDEDSCLSFDEWKDAGYFVKKGSKSHFTDALGIPQFTKEQVEKSRW